MNNPFETMSEQDISDILIKLGKVTKSVGTILVLVGNGTSTLMIAGQPEFKPHYVTALEDALKAAKDTERKAPNQGWVEEPDDGTIAE